MTEVLSFLEGLSKKARRCYEEGKFTLAVDLYRQLIQLNPNSMNSWFGKALAHQDLGEHRKAIHCYQQVHKRDPEHHGVFNNSACSYWALGYKKAAIRRYQTAIVFQVKKKSSDPYAFINLVGCYEELESMEDALMVADYWLKHFPECQEARATKESLIRRMPSLRRLKPISREGEVIHG